VVLPDEQCCRGSGEFFRPCRFVSLEASATTRSRRSRITHWPFAVENGRRHECPVAAGDLQTGRDRNRRTFEGRAFQARRRAGTAEDGTGRTAKFEFFQVYDDQARALRSKGGRFARTVAYVEL